MRRSCLLAASLLWLQPTLVVAQPQLNLLPTCLDCRVRVEEAVRLQSLWENGSTPAMPTAFTSLGGGGWLLANSSTGLVERFDSRGRQAGAFARRGAGPGEISRAGTLVPWPGDSVLIVDHGLGRFQVFASTGMYARGGPWTGAAPTQVLLRPGRRFIAPTNRNTSDGAAIPFHEFSAEGALLRSFGAAPNEKIASRDQLPRYRVGAATAADGSFWSIDARSPRLRHWDRNGALDAEWVLPFRDFVPVVTTREGSPPGAEFTVLEQTADGALIVAMAFRARDFERSYGDGRPVDGVASRVVEDVGRFFDTRVFVLDPQTRTLLTSADIDPILFGSLGAGRFWGVAAGGYNGEVVVLQLTTTR